MNIGILQFIPQLEDAAWGFMGALEAKLGFRPSFDLLEADGDETACPGLARKLVEKNCDLLFGCLTPAVTALMEVAAPMRIPVVFAPVFHPVLSGIIENEEVPGGFVTGVTGRLDPYCKIEKISLLFPDLEEVTVIANGKDRFSLWEAHALVDAFQENGVTAELNEVQSGHPLPAMGGRVHMLAFSPELEETMEEWIEPFYTQRAPLIGSSARAGFLGAVMAVFADHGALGGIAGEMAAEILNGTPPGRLSVRHPQEASFGFNYHAAGKFGIRIPPRLGQRVDIL
jgi:putative ABC transport system substrate-binding protein